MTPGEAEGGADERDIVGATITEFAGDSEGDGVDEDDRSWLIVGVEASDSASRDVRDDALLLRVCTSELAESSLCHLELL